MRNYLLSLVLVSSAAFSQPSALVFEPENLRVYDGDTIITTWQPVKMLRPISLRIEGIDTPELRGKCQQEIALAKEARKELKSQVAKGPITAYLIDWDKYGGRVVARVTAADGTDVSERMIKLGLARPFTGKEAKTSWCN
jgi:micrococcal nuclease